MSGTFSSNLWERLHTATFKRRLKSHIWRLFQFYFTLNFRQILLTSVLAQCLRLALSTEQIFLIDDDTLVKTHHVRMTKSRLNTEICRRILVSFSGAAKILNSGVLKNNSHLVYTYRKMHLFCCSCYKLYLRGRLGWPGDPGLAASVYATGEFVWRRPILSSYAALSTSY